MADCEIESRTNPDGTRLPALRAAESIQATEKPQTPLQSPVMLDDLSAVMAALSAIFEPMPLHSTDRVAYLSGRVEIGQMRMQKIYFDTPRPEDDLEFPSMTITCEKTDLDISDINMQQIDQNTLDCFAPGTVLQHLGTANSTLTVTIWFGHKDDRAGARKSIIETLMGEIGDERPGRRVLMPYYYNQTAQFDLMSVSYPDQQDMSKANEYPMVLEISSAVELVRLVAAPGYFKPSIPLVEFLG